MVVKKSNLKTVAPRKRDRLYSASLLVKMGSPMIVLLTCMLPLKEI